MEKQKLISRKIRVTGKGSELFDYREFEKRMDSLGFASLYLHEPKHYQNEELRYTHTSCKKCNSNVVGCYSVPEHDWGIVGPYSYGYFNGTAIHWDITLSERDFEKPRVVAFYAEICGPREVVLREKKNIEDLLRDLVCSKMVFLTRTEERDNGALK